VVADKVKSHSGKRRTQGTTLQPSRSRVAELYAFDEQIHSSFYERCTQGATLRPSVASGFMPDVEEKTSQTSCDATALTIAGFDEAGRGALAGPVVVACVHFPPVLFTAEDAENAENSYRGKNLGDLCGERKEGLAPDKQRPSAKTSTAEHAKDAEHYYKKEGFLCDLGDLCGEMKETTGLHFGSIFHTLAGLDDSKRLSPQKREALYERICTLSKWGVGWASHSVIDRRGIVPALTLAAGRAYRAMGQRADLLLFDRGLSLHERPSSKASTAEDAKTAEHYYKKEGSLCELGDLCGEMKRSSLPSCDATPELAFTKGDGRSLHIAAASILAKVSRDRAMTRVHARFPDYGFDRNKGYGTASHFATLRRLGPSSIHRRSFRLH